MDKKHKKIKKLLDDQYLLPGLIRVKTGEICPADVVAVLAPWGHRTEVRPMFWGLPRNFAAPTSRKGSPEDLLINSSLELALSRPVLTGAFLHNPVAVPVNGFYGWTSDKDEEPGRYFFTSPNNSVLYLAGFYNVFDANEGPVRERFTLLTTASNKDFARYSHRMPVILTENELGAWLSGREPGNFLDRSGLGLEARAAA